MSRRDKTDEHDRIVRIGNRSDRIRLAERVDRLGGNGSDISSIGGDERSPRAHGNRTWFDWACHRANLNIVGRVARRSAIVLDHYLRQRCVTDIRDLIAVRDRCARRSHEPRLAVRCVARTLDDTDTGGGISEIGVLERLNALRQVNQKRIQTKSAAGRMEQTSQGATRLKIALRQRDPVEDVGFIDLELVPTLLGFGRPEVIASQKLRQEGVCSGVKFPIAVVAVKLNKHAIDPKLAGIEKTIGVSVTPDEIAQGGLALWHGGRGDRGGREKRGGVAGSLGYVEE
jgi:hypothetical protein